MKLTLNYDDGDQTTIKILWTQEANAECEKYMNNPSFFVQMNGSFVRFIELEGIQTFYNMTKNSNTKNKKLSVAESTALLQLQPNDFTFEKIVDILGNTDGKEAKYQPEDKMTILTGQYHDNKEPIETTVGRYMFNRILLDGCGLYDIFGYVNEEITEGFFLKGMERTIATALIEKKIPIENMYQYVDTRDWLSLQLHAVITPSFTPNTFGIHPEVQKLKDELFKKYAKELEEGDAVTGSLIENALVDKTKEVLKDDIGMDLYNSGARGSIANNYKNMFLMRGSVYNRATGKFEIVKNSLSDGLAISDIPISSNTILEGAYPKACGTRDSGYLSKKLLAECQTEFLDDPGSDCGTKRGIKMILPKQIAKDYIYRYIKEKGKLILLTNDNINNYADKEIELRTPMTCIKGEHGGICNKCAGEFYYMVNNQSIGLSASRIGNSLTNLNMKKFHDNTIKFSDVDLDDIII